MNKQRYNLKPIAPEATWQAYLPRDTQPAHCQTAKLFHLALTHHVSEEAADAETADVPGQRTESGARGSLVKHGDVYYLHSPDHVHEILKVERVENIAFDST